MTIETKYKIGDTFWKLNPKTYKAEPHQVAVIVASVELIPGDNYSHCEQKGVAYTAHGGVKVNEPDFFPTKEALLASL